MWCARLTPSQWRVIVKQVVMHEHDKADILARIAQGNGRPIDITYTTKANSAWERKLPDAHGH